uniref:tRNA (guanine(9)-N(1))-methyltransferase n=1 Tax=Medicago truncatula TaxID=3880 RepID=A2Q1R6_MEDTR|nr:tRNA (guanine-N1-)-methyltransferase [Medicago truncatula]
MEPNHERESTVPLPKPEPSQPTSELSKNAKKKLARQERWEAKKADKKAAAKEQKKKETERKRKEWEESIAGITEEERVKVIEARMSLRKERMEKRLEEKNEKKERLVKAKELGQNVVVDVEFSHLMTPQEIRSLVQQIMYCYAVNGRCDTPAHLWLTGCEGEMDNQLKKIPGFDKWIIEKENKSYIEVLADRKDDLVYLTADSEDVLEELDLKKIYIIGGLVDRNRFKGITMEKAQEQGIRTAKLPIGNFLKMSSSQLETQVCEERGLGENREIEREFSKEREKKWRGSESDPTIEDPDSLVLTVNQVVEILLKFLETRDWKTSFFAVIPQRKRSQADSEGNADNTVDEDIDEDEEEESEQKDDLLTSKKQCVEEIPSNKLVDEV